MNYSEFVGRQTYPGEIRPIMAYTERFYLKEYVFQLKVYERVGISIIFLVCKKDSQRIAVKKSVTQPFLASSQGRSVA